MGKSCQLSPELWPLIDVILFSYIELIFRGGVSCLPAALLLRQVFTIQSKNNLSKSMAEGFNKRIKHSFQCINVCQARV